MKYTSAIYAAFALLGLCAMAPARADVTRIEQTDPTISYQGTWHTVNGSAVSGGSVVAANSADASVTVDFSGTGIAWIGYRSRQAGGFARVYLDGTLQTTVGTYATSPEPQVEIFRIGGLADGAHTLRIEVTGEMQGGDPGGGDAAYVVIDAFDVDDGESAQLIQESDFSVTYSGGWIELDDPSVSGGSVRASRNVNASAYVTFNGTGIEWIGYRCPCAGAGIAQINLLESGFLAYKHTWAPQHEAQQTIYRIDGLPPGEHRLEIYVTGNSVTADPANAWVVVDAFRIIDGGGSGGGPENILPTVTLTAPEPDALVTGVVTLAADAADNVGVTKVQFFTTTGLLLGEDFTAPYSITRDTSAIPSGSSYMLYARAIDAAGNLGTSTSVRATVQHEDRSRPVVSITEPAAGSTVSGTIAIAANASDDQGVASVAFSRDSYTAYPLGTDTSAPYTASFDTLTQLDGAHELLARAFDGAGNADEATPVTITVDNSVQPGMIRIDDDNPAVVFSGDWSLTDDREAEGGPMFHWGSAAVSGTMGATATLTFQGTGVRWISYNCDFFCGDASVSIDGGPAEAVSLRGGGDYGEPRRVAESVYTSPVLTNGTHTLTITVENDHPSGSGNVIVDAFEVLTE